MKHHSIWKLPQGRQLALLLLPLLAALLPVRLETYYRAYLHLGTQFSKGEAWLIYALFYFAALRVRSVWFSTLMSVLFFSFLFFQFAHLGLYHSWLSSAEILLFFEEYSEVYRTGVTLLPSLLLPLLIALLCLLPSLLLRRIKQPKSDSRLLIALFSLLLIAPVAQSALARGKDEQAPHQRYSAIRSGIETTSVFLGKTAPQQLKGQSGVEKYEHEAPAVLHDAGSRVIVLLMGESQNVDNMSVFGYGLDTTPWLREHAKEGVLLSAYAGGVYTNVSLPTFFNMIPQPDGTAQIYSWRTNLFRLAKAQGYHTVFYTAQAKSEMSLLSMLGQQYIDDIRDPTHYGHAYHENAYDDELLPLLRQLDLSQGKHFIVLHQRGSHPPYAERSRPDEKRFGQASLEAEYNNSVARTDALLGQVLDHLGKQRDWTFVFTSDHGQYVKHGAMGHGLLNMASHYMVPAYIRSVVPGVMPAVRETFRGCDTLFHVQLSELLARQMGYAVPDSTCTQGYVNGARLNGSAGYKKISLHSVMNNLPLPMSKRN